MDRAAIAKPTNDRANQARTSNFSFAFYSGGRHLDGNRPNHRMTKMRVAFRAQLPVFLRSVIAVIQSPRRIFRFAKKRRRYAPEPCVSRRPPASVTVVPRRPDPRRLVVVGFCGFPKPGCCDRVRPRGLVSSTAPAEWNSASDWLALSMQCFCMI
jgi:hypothetical protein